MKFSLEFDATIVCRNLLRAYDLESFFAPAQPNRLTPIAALAPRPQILLLD